MPLQPIVICGAGIAGVATAHHLTNLLSIDDVVIVDPRPPLTLTSDKSTECYRNWWPNEPMVQLMNRSIDLLEDFERQSGGSFGMNRRGYLFVTADADRLDAMTTAGRQTASWGGGALRQHTDLTNYQTHRAHGLEGPEGADVLVDGALHGAFPYLDRAAVGALHVRRAGWLSAQQLGAWMLQQATDRGARLVKAEVTDIDCTGDRVTGVVLDDGSRLECRAVVNAAGPMQRTVAAMAGVDLPLYSEVHVKVAFRDVLSAIPRDAPMLIWSDPQVLPWSDEERQGLIEYGRPGLVGELPGFCHGRPEGAGESPWVLALWEYDHQVIEPVWPVPTDELYAEVVLRGMTAMVPSLGRYLERLPEPVLDGGYYTRASDNRPVVGPVGPDGFVMAGGIGGFGVMAAAAVGELAARSVAGLSSGDLAPHFSPSRFDDPAALAEDIFDGQL